MSNLRRPAEMFDRDREWRALSAFAKTRPGRRISRHRFRPATAGQDLPAARAVPGDRRVLLRGRGSHRRRVLATGIGAPAGRPPRRSRTLAVPTTGPKRWTCCSRWAAKRHPCRHRRVPLPGTSQPAPSLDHPERVRAAAPERDDSRPRCSSADQRCRSWAACSAAARPCAGEPRSNSSYRRWTTSLAAEFWDVEDPATASKVNAIVGGTPAYRREFARDDTPQASPEDFDPWVLRTVLSPTSPLFREARYLLADEPDLRDTPCITRSWPPSPPGTPPAATSRPTSAASPAISPTP